MKKVYVFLFSLLMCFMVACVGTQNIDADKENVSSETQTSEATENVEDESVSEDAGTSDAEKVDHVADWEYTEWEEGREIKTGDSIQLGVTQVYQGNTYLMWSDTHVPDCRYFLGENSLSAVLKEADGSETELMIYEFCLTDEYMVFASRLEDDPSYYRPEDGLRIFVKEQDGTVRQIAEKIQDSYVDSGKLIALNTENQVQVYDLATGGIEKQIQIEDDIFMYYMCREYIIYSKAGHEIVHYYLETGDSDTVAYTGRDGEFFGFFISDGNLYGYSQKENKVMILYEQGEKTSGVLPLPLFPQEIREDLAYMQDGSELKTYHIVTKEIETIYTIPDENEERGIDTSAYYYGNDRVVFVEFRPEEHKDYYFEVDLEGNVKIIGEVQLDPNL